MHKHFIAVAAALALSGCSTTYSNGVRFLVGEGATPRAGDGVPPQLDQLATEWARSAAPGVLVVGDIGALNAMDGKQLRAFHQAYAEALAKRDPARAVGASADDFAASMGGLSSIETFGLAGFVKLERPAAVRVADMGTVGFASTTGALFGSTGDLVAARGDASGMLVLDKVLCKEKSAAYKECMSRYARGHFSQAGAELDGDLQPKRNGRRIDPANYLLLAHGGAQ